uniref:MFS domain-containing protein n=1 Tax=Panagrellus redivivus TaxID=6233 RepID=A0A7E4W9P6_PANRE
MPFNNVSSFKSSPLAPAANAIVAPEETEMERPPRIGGRSHFDFGNSTRYVIVFLSLACLTFICANSLTLNFTVICMVKDSVAGNGFELEQDIDFGSNVTVKSEPIFDPMETSWLFSAIAIGQIFGTIPITYFTNQYGVRKTFTVYGLLSGASTLLIPTAVRYGFYPVFFMRILEGFAMATSFPALGAIVAEWATIKSNGLFLAILSIHLQLGSIFTMPISGKFCDSSYGWPAVYYLQGFLTLLCFVVFASFYRDSPGMHRNVSAKELQKISVGKLHILSTKPGAKRQRQPVPYRAILTDLSVWGIFISCFGGNFGYQLITQFGPTYLNKVLGFSVQKTGFAAAAPFVFSIMLKMIGGPFSDRFTLISERARVIMFNSIAQFPMSICLILMALLPVEYVGFLQIAFIAAGAFCGLNALGVSKSVQMISQQHCHFILAMNTFIVSAVMLIFPPIVSYLTPDNTPEQWAWVFYGVAFIVTTTAIFFNFTAQASPRPWTLSSSTSSAQIVDAGVVPTISAKMASPLPEKANFDA